MKYKKIWDEEHDVRYQKPNHPVLDMDPCFKKSKFLGQITIFPHVVWNLTLYLPKLSSVRFL